MAETLTNNAATTLSLPITSATATVCNVASATGFPTTGNFRIRIDNEICLVIEVVGSQFVMVRGQEGTIAVGHSSGVAVTHVLTKGALEARVADRFVTDLYANKPLPGVKGRLFQPTDGFYLEYDDGAAWHKYGPCVRMVPPPVTGWSWINQGNATATHTGSALILEDPDMDATATQLRLYVRPITKTGLVKAAFAISGLGTNSGHFGMCYRQSGGTYDGRISCCDVNVTAGLPYMARREFINPTTTSGSTSTSNGIFPIRVIWMKYDYWTDGYTRYCMYSWDGVNYKYGAGATSHTIYPNQIGIYIDPTNNAQKFSVSLVHWEES
jgi:hypothetical protein